MRRVLWDGWRIVDKIGEGSTGEVYKAVKNNGNANVYSAIKYISFPKTTGDIDELIRLGLIKSRNEANDYYKKILDELKKDFDIIRRYNNQYILNYYDYYQEPHRDGVGYDVYLRMELVSEVLGDFNNKKLLVNDIAQMGIDICNALEFLKRYGIVHKNIKPNNIFIGSDGKYKLGDFGALDKIDNNCLYVAPEVYKNENITNSADLYSLGLVMYQFLNRGKLPFVSLFVSDKMAFKLRMSGSVIPIIKGVSNDLMTIIFNACAFYVTDRYKDVSVMKAALQRFLTDNGKDNSIANNNAQNIIGSNKTISIYDVNRLANSNVDSSVAVDNNNKIASNRRHGFIYDKFLNKIIDKKESIFGEDNICEKIIDSIVELREKLSDKQFYIDNRKNIIIGILIILLLLLLKGCVFSTKKCDKGYINNYGLCVKGWYTCDKGYSLNKNNKCSKTLKSIDANVKYVCDDGYTLQDKLCLKSDTKDAKQAYQCAGLGRLEGDKCIQEQKTKAAVTYTCPSGYILYDNKCSTASNKTASASYSCPSGYTLSGNKCSKTEYSSPITSGGGYSCSSGDTLSGSKCYRNATCSTSGGGYNNSYICRYNPYYPGCQSSTTTTCECPYGYTKSGTQCYKDANYNRGSSYCSKGSLSGGSCVYSVTIPAIVKYSCPSGYRAYGNQCITTSSIQPSPKYYCAGGLELKGDQCVATITADAIKGFECSDGYALAGNTCVLNDKKDAKAEYSCSKVYTLNGDKCEKYKILSPIKHFGEKK